MTPSMLVFNYTLPGYPAAAGNTGLLMNISQGPCVGTNGAANPICCKADSVLGSVCANWASARLGSRGCIYYGVLETEAAFIMPAASGAVFFAG